MATFHGSLLCLYFALLMAMVSATQYKVGGSMGWTVPIDPNAASYNQWAERNRFQIGDSLLFVYLPDKDSVLLVDSEAYKSCNTSSYIDLFDDGNTVFTFKRPGPFYFISGNRDNCVKNESLVVVVMADRSSRSGLAPAPAPSPDVVSSPPHPGGELVFAPASPAGEESAPSLPNGASTKMVGLVGMIGGFIGSLFFF